MTPVRVAITGIGLVTPLATGTRESWSSLLAGGSGIGPITHFDASSFTVRAAAEVNDLDPRRFVPAHHDRHMDRYCLLGVAAARLALEDAGEPALPDETAVIMGVGLGGLETIERNHEALAARGPRFVSPYLIPMIIPNMAAGWISMLSGIRGRSLTLATACASGAHAVGEAFWLLRSGRVAMALAGGAEAAITPLGVGGFAAMRALSQAAPEGASRPFDEGRDGFVLGEGAAVLVLEREDAAVRRGARIYARVAGYGATSDAHDLTQPDPGGAGAIEAMRQALADAGIPPGRVGYVNAHATSTPIGDRIEAGAIGEIFGRGAVAVSSTKGATGHLLGAAGALEAAFTALSLHHGILPHTLNLVSPDPECDLDHVMHEPRRAEVRAALSNAFGFGGTNATLVLERGGET